MDQKGKVPKTTAPSLSREAKRSACSPKIEEKKALTERLSLRGFS